MALIKCPECEKEISDKSKICIGCGFPIEEYLEDKKIQNTIPNKENCPYCGSEKIDANGYCDECGMMISSYKNINTNDSTEIAEEPHTICPNCGKYNKTGIFICTSCKYKYKMDDYNVIVPDDENNEETFNGIYKYTFLGEKQKVYCPRCSSSNCSHYKEQKVIKLPTKVKGRYSRNFNPFRPFTFANKKEKIINNDIHYTADKIICNSCGKIFS